MAGLWSVVTPEEAYNFVANPSFERGTDGWSASAGSIAQSTTDSTYGYACGKFTPGGGTDDELSCEVTLAGESYYLSTWIKAESGVNYSIGYETSDGSGASMSAEQTGTGDWQHVEYSMGAGLNGNYKVIIQSTTTDVQPIMVDGVLVANVAHLTDYIDGDQPGCYWLGKEHGSKSRRKISYRMAGQEVNLDTYNAYVEEVTGAGMAPIENYATRQYNVPGAVYEDYGVAPRQFVIKFKQTGTSLADLHLQRKTLLDAIKPDGCKGAQPFLLRYTGANSAKSVEIACVLAEESATRTAWTSSLDLRLIAFDPFFRETIEDAYYATELNSSLAMTGIGGFIAVSTPYRAWSSLKGGLISGGLGGTPTCILKASDGKIYVGGAFTGAGTTATDSAYIARYNPISTLWEGLSTDGGLDGVVYAMAELSDGTIAMGGSFLDVASSSDESFKRVCLYNPATSTFSQIGNGFDDTVYALAMDDNNVLYAGGAFHTSGVTTVGHAAKWKFNRTMGTSDSMDWLTTSGNTDNGFNNEVRVLIRGPEGGNSIYAGGLFTLVDGSTDNYFAHHCDTGWESLSAGVSMPVYALYADKDGSVLIGTTTNGTNCCAQRWSGSNLEPIGVNGTDLSDTDDIITGFGRDADGVLFAGGNFMELWHDVDGVTGLSGGLAEWYGYKWGAYNSLSAEELYSAPFYIDPISNDLYRQTCSDTDFQYITYATVVNNGTATAYPRIEIARDSDTDMYNWFYLWRVENFTSGKIVRFNGYPLRSGERVTITTNPGELKIISNRTGDISAWIERNSDLAGFGLLPGTNYVGIFVYKKADVASKTGHFAVTWKPTHWSFDGSAT